MIVDYSDKVRALGVLAECLLRRELGFWVSIWQGMSFPSIRTELAGHRLHLRCQPRKHRPRVARGGMCDNKNVQRNRLALLAIFATARSHNIIRVRVRIKTYRCIIFKLVGKFIVKRVTGRS